MSDQQNPQSNDSLEDESNMPNTHNNQSLKDIERVTDVASDSMDMNSTAAHSAMLSVMSSTSSSDNNPSSTTDDKALGDKVEEFMKLTSISGRSKAREYFSGDFSLKSALTNWLKDPCY